MPELPSLSDTLPFDTAKLFPYSGRSFPRRTSVPKFLSWTIFSPDGFSGPSSIPFISAGLSEESSFCATVFFSLWAAVYSRLRIALHTFACKSVQTTDGLSKIVGVDETISTTSSVSFTPGWRPKVISPSTLPPSS